MTDLLATIDETIAGWEAQPEAWNPGDPLYDRPNRLAFGGEDDQYVRPMFELLEQRTLVRWRCEPCQVAWRGPDPCWVCGEERFEAQGWLAHAVERMTRELDDRIAEIVVATPEPAPALTIERLEEAIDQLRRSRPVPREPMPAPPRHVQTRCFLVPTVEDITAPTADALAQNVGTDLGEFVIAFDPARPPAPPAADDDTRTVPTFWGDVVVARARYPRPTTEETR